MTAGPTIDYDALAQEAMRGVVRTVLARTAKSGLPGDHHFYISFDTQHAGVVMSKRLKDKYPQEMTIVLQHRFWDLAVTDERFEVKLTFDGIPERLVIPYTALKVFFDPSVSYGLQFEDPDAGARHGLPLDGEDTPERRPTAMTTRSSSPRKPRSTRAKTRDGEGAEPDTVVRPAGETPRAPTPRPTLTPVHRGAPNGTPQPAAKSTEPAAAGQAAGRTADADQKGDSGAKAEPKEKAPATAEIEAANKPGPTPVGGAQIVSLDAFRKK